MWERKHEPRNISQVALAPEHRRSFESFLARRVIPRDLILVGPTGHGKTTMAKVLERSLAFQARTINASGRGGVDTVRGEITRLVFAGKALACDLSANPGAPYRVIRLEEAQGMTPEALAALRTVVDDRPDWVRFVLTGNRLPNDEPFVNRFRVIEFSSIPVDEKVRVIDRILAAEDLAADRELIIACAKWAPTMRDLIDHLERSFAECGGLQPPSTKRTKEPRPVKKNADLFLAVYEIIREFGRPREWPLKKRRLATREILDKLKEEGRELEDTELATALDPFGVHSKTFTNPDEKSAHGYTFAAVDEARIANRV